MKKKSLLAGGFMLAMVAATGGYHAFTSNSSLEENLLMENVEALSENTEGNEFEYPNGYPYTSTCNVAIGTNRKCKVVVITCQGGGSGCNSKKCPVHPA